VLLASTIAHAVREGIARAAFELRPDVATALAQAMETERSERGRSVLAQLIESSRIASDDRAVMSDTAAWVRIELGSEETLTGNVQTEVDATVADVYRSASLRMSLVRDALLDRSNTGDNTPAFIDIVWRPGTGASVSVMLKGGGSDNASRVSMLTPEEGFEESSEPCLRPSEDRGGACPPLHRRGIATSTR
jgi:tartrate/fumarate subfamily iron-sulfur-dependent hydro-lyase alpha chain